MAINFPTSPVLNQIYTYNSFSWIWNGTYWDIYGTSTNPSGSTGTTSYAVAFDYTRSAAGLHWHPFLRTYSFTTGNVFGTKAYPIMVERTVTIDAIFLRGNLVNTGVTMLVGLYDNIENEAKPGNLIAAGTASFNLALTGLQTITIPQVTLQPAIYWVGFSLSNGPSGFANISIFSLTQQYYMLGINPGNGNPQLVWIEPTVYTTSMPAVWDNAGSSYLSNTGGNCPYLSWRVIA